MFIEIDRERKCLQLFIRQNHLSSLTRIKILGRVNCGRIIKLNKNKRIINEKKKNKEKQNNDCAERKVQHKRKLLYTIGRKDKRYLFLEVIELL